MSEAATPLREVQRPSLGVLDAFIGRHEYLLQLERASEEEQTRLLNSKCSPKLLEQRGLAILGLGVSAVNVGLGGKTLIELHRPSAYHTSPSLPPHSFRNGDPVRIESHSSASSKKSKKLEEAEQAGVDGVVYKVSQEKVVVSVDEKKEIDLAERLRLVKMANSVTFDRMDKTLARLRRILLPVDAEPVSGTVIGLPLVEALMGLTEPTWRGTMNPKMFPPPTADFTEYPNWFDASMNASQKEAVEFCLKAEHIACIHGPPGTGKTHTLIELIFQILSRPASPTSTSPRILVATPSNLALDNLLLRLHLLSKRAPYSTLLPPRSILRLGHPTRVHRDLLSETLDYRAANGDDGALLRDVGKDIEGHLGDLGKPKGTKGAVKGKERNQRYQEVHILRKEFRQREAKVVTNAVAAAKVVLATCHSAGGRQLNNVPFDVAIIDEATQAVEAVCWVPILKARKLILAGDPQQLPPTIMSKADAIKPELHGGAAKPEVQDLSNGTAKLGLSIKSAELRPPKSLETTLFDRLEKMYGGGIKRVLQVQYRMNKHIASFPSDTLYDSSLISDTTVAKRTLHDLPTIEASESDDAKDTLSPPVIFFDTAGCEFYERSEADDTSPGEGSKMNENEAELVSKWARKLIGLGVPSVDIGIVTPYQAQVSLISSLLHDDFPDMTIGTVDGLQGQEREAIILSLVRSNDKGEVGFLGEYRRLNVAMTRAKRQLCVVGDSATVGKGSAYLKKWMGWLEANADVRWAGEESI